MSRFVRKTDGILEGAEGRFMTQAVWKRTFGEHYAHRDRVLYDKSLTSRAKAAAMQAKHRFDSVRCDNGHTEPVFVPKVW